MSLSSINTNVTAYVALQSLNATNSALACDPEGGIDRLPRRGRDR